MQDLIYGIYVGNMDKKARRHILADKAPKNNVWKPTVIIGIIFGAASGMLTRLKNRVALLQG